MNIFELTRILNEAKERTGYKVADNLISAVSELNNLIDSDVVDDETKSVVRKFFSKTTRIVDDKKDEITQSDNKRNYILNSDCIKSFGLTNAELVGLKDVLSELSGRPLGKFLQKNKKITSCNLKEFLNIDDDSFFEIASISKIKPQTSGPFELLLCLLFNGQKLPNNSDKKGDIVLGSTVYEVKGDGSGCIDSGLTWFKEKMASAKPSELQKLKQQFKIKQIEYNQSVKEANNHAEVFAKNLIDKKQMNIVDVENYFSLLDDEDKKRAIMYGFYNIGYKNIIICKYINGGADIFVKVVSDKEIQNYIQSNTQTIGTLGIDIVLPKSSKKSMTCNFGSYKIKIIR